MTIEKTGRGRGALEYSTDTLEHVLKINDVPVTDKARAAVLKAARDDYGPKGTSKESGDRFLDKTELEEATLRLIDQGVLTAGPSLDGLSPKTNIREALSVTPPEVLQNYHLSLSKDARELTFDPPLRPTMRAMRGGFSHRPSERGGQIISLAGGAVEKGQWVEMSLREVLEHPDHRAAVKAAHPDVGDRVIAQMLAAQERELIKGGYDLDSPQQLLIVQAERDRGPTIFALSNDPANPGIAGICSEVTVLPFSADAGETRPPIMVRKPVVYLYPSARTEVRVGLAVQGDLVAQYPALHKATARGGEWNVVASPDGTLFDRNTEQEYPYLFWEAADFGTLQLDLQQAFTVERAQARAFLENIAKAYALNMRERTDFVSYWLPHLERNALSVVQLLGESYTQYARLDVRPQPDTVIRLFMVFREAHGEEKTGNPTLPQRQRQGFTVVEWGGADLDETRS